MLYDRRPLMRPAGYTQPRRFTSQLGFMDFNVNMLLAPRVDFLAYLASPCDSLCPELRELFTSNLTKPAKPAATKSAAPTKQAASASKRGASEEVEEEAEEKEAPAPRPAREARRQPHLQQVQSRRRGQPGSAGAALGRSPPRPRQGGAGSQAWAHTQSSSGSSAGSCRRGGAAGKEGAARATGAPAPRAEGPRPALRAPRARPTVLKSSETYISGPKR